MISVTFQFTQGADDDGHCAEYELEAVSYDARVLEVDVTAVDSEGRYVEPTVEMYQEARRRLLRELYAVQATAGGEGDYVRQVEWEY
jgi:hypothetical protein